MKYLNSINKSIEFIENNLNKPIKCDEIANNIGYSLYHFNRMFSSIVGETPVSYLRKRRLAESAKELKNSSKKVIDISLDYCFGSQESFSRSFKSMFGVSPIEYRNSNISSLQSFERIFLKNNSINKEFSMKHRIEKKEQIILVGLEHHVKGIDFNYTKAWDIFMKDMQSISNKKSYSCFGLGVYPETFPEPWEYIYMTAVEVTEVSDVPLHLSFKIIPESSYVVFTHVGSNRKIAESFEYIYSKGLAELGYSSKASYDFEYYDERFSRENPETSEMEIWIPIKS